MAKIKRLAPKAPKHTVRLDLTEEEARTFKSILRSVGGNPTDSRRKYADSVYAALHHAGVTHLPDNQRTGSIRFLTPDEMASRL